MIDPSFDFLLIGHRGVPENEPENTLASFQKALDMGCGGIELDVHLCKSGEPVVIHDETIDRTTNGIGAVKDRTLYELKFLDAGNGEKIPTLKEVLHLINCQAKVFIEIKDLDAVSPVAEIIEHFVEEHGWNYENLVMISFYELEITNTYIQRGLSFYEYTNIPENVNTINPSISALSPEIVSSAHAKGIAVFVWVVRTVDELQQALDAGVDGVMVDDPALYSIPLPLREGLGEGFKKI